MCSGNDTEMVVNSGGIYLYVYAWYSTYAACNIILGRHTVAT
jgi:hypothetical protein